MPDFQTPYGLPAPFTPLPYAGGFNMADAPNSGASPPPPHISQALDQIASMKNTAEARKIANGKILASGRAAQFMSIERELEAATAAGDSQQFHDLLQQLIALYQEVLKLSPTQQDATAQPAGATP